MNHLSDSLLDAVKKGDTAEVAKHLKDKELTDRLPVAKIKELYRQVGHVIIIFSRCTCVSCLMFLSNALKLLILCIHVINILNFITSCL